MLLLNWNIQVWGEEGHTKAMVFCHLPLSAEARPGCVQVRANVARLTSDVQEGSLQRMSQQLADSSGRAREAAAPRRRPYSVFLSQVRRQASSWMRSV